MKRILLPAALVCAAALLVPSQAAAIIQLDRGIAGARLLNTKAQVKKALGQPKRIVNRIGADDVPFTEFRYAGRITVIFRGGGNNVTAVSTEGLGDRTARGVGVGSTRQAVRNRVPGVSCENVGGGRAICQRGQSLPGRRITAFFLRNGVVRRVTVGFVPA
jgi:hypothetical protein